MKDYATESIRNVTLVGHGSTGKTTLTEAALFRSGAISRLGRVDDGTTTSDYDPDEVKRRISVNLSLLPCEWKAHKINLIDTPGYADFVGEARGGLRAGDAALVVVCAASGVQVGTENAWGLIRESHIPAAIIINRLDRENADFQRSLEQVRTALAAPGVRFAPVHLAIGAQDGFQGVVDLLALKAYTSDQDVEGEVPTSLADQVNRYHEQLIEAIAETDDALINKYLEGEELTLEELRRGLRAAVRSGSVVPVFAASGLKSIGIGPLLDALNDYLPSPADIGEVTATSASGGEEKLSSTADGPLAVLVFKTTADPYVGKLSYLRVCSGTLKADSQVWNANKGKSERIGQLFLLRGKSQEQTGQLIAGDIGAVAKLAETSTGDTLCQRERPLTLPPITFPEPAYSAAVHPKTKADLDKLGVSLSRLVEEDPTLRVHRDQDTNETILSGLGESHVEVAVEKMRRKFGVDVALTLPKVPYRETITSAAQAEYTHKKQTGGHGQYARVAIALEPLPRGSGFQFTDRIVGGVVPKTYIPAVEKGVVEAMREGVLARYPLTDLKVMLYDGKDHPVDSSEIAFKLAGAMALKKGASEAHPVLLEPIVNLSITVPEANTGDVMSDLNSRRAKVLGMTPRDGFSVIEAQAPLAEVQRYATDLRSITQGRGSYKAEFSHYEEVPAHIAQKIIEAAQRQKEG